MIKSDIIFIMLFLLFSFCLSKKPIVILPPLYGSNLYVTYQNVSGLHSYCPQKVTDKLLWVSPSFVVPPSYNCMFQLLQVFWDNETQGYQNRENVTITTHDFGGDSTVKYVAHGVGGFIKLIETFRTLLKYFRHKGYIPRKDIFAAPFDWRFAVAGLDYYWPNLQALVEHAYRSNKNTKVSIFAFSCGGFSLQQFLAEHVSQEWKDKYLDRAVFLAPSFAGAGASLPAMWEKIFPLVPIIKNQDLSDMIESMPVIHQHYPNWEIFGNKEVIRTPNDESLTARDVPDFLIKHGKVTLDNIKIMKKCANISSKAPRGPGLPTYIIYNSAIPTDFNLKFKGSYDSDPIVEHTDGDGTVFSAGPEYACRNWGTPIHCVDVRRDAYDFEHQPLASNPFVLDLIYKATTTDKWMENNKSRKLVVAPYVEIINNGTYAIHPELRPKKYTIREN